MTYIPKRPYGSFSNSATQTLTTAGTTYNVAFDTDESKFNITHSTVTNNSRITVDKAGTYLITFSAIGETPLAGGANKHIVFSLAVGGTPVARSGTVDDFTAGQETVITVTYVYAFTAGQYFEIQAVSDVNSATIKATAANAIAGTHPASPNIILTVNWISD